MNKELGGMDLNVKELNRQLEIGRSMHVELLNKIDRRDVRLRHIHEHPYRFLLRVIYRRYVRRDIKIWNE